MEAHKQIQEIYTSGVIEILGTSDMKSDSLRRKCLISVKARRKVVPRFRDPGIRSDVRLRLFTGLLFASTLPDQSTNL